MNRSCSHFASAEKQNGLSLVELMIALLLGTLLTVGLVQVFTSNSQSFRHNESLSRALESGRIATDILSRALRNAGFFGCFPVEGVTNNLDDSDTLYVAELHGFATLGVSAEDSGSYSERPDDAISGTDFFNVTGVRRPGAIVQLDEDMTDTTDITLTEQGSLEENELLYISDCEHGDIFSISSLVAGSGSVTITADNSSGSSGVPGNELSGNSPAACSTSGSCLSGTYMAGTELFQPYSEAYFIGTASDGSNSLFMRQSDGSTVELVSGVEDMQIRFGEGSDSTVDNWLESGSVSDWEDVLAVEVSLLVAAPTDNVLSEAQTYCFPGWQDCVADTSLLSTADDERVYRVFTFTSALRNEF